MASSGQITVRIAGLEELQGKLQSSRADKPVARFLDRASIYLQREARRVAPIDSGRLRNSIGIESPNTRMRRIGPNVEYGEDVEFGTRPHMPPPGELADWSRKRGLSEYAVSMKISIYGTKAQPYMQPAADATEMYIPTLIPVLAAEIESAFQ